MAVVDFTTFGFMQAFCGAPLNRFHGGAIGDSFIGQGSVLINGYDYDFGDLHHPAAGNIFDRTTNPLSVRNWGIAGNHISFMFRKTTQKCLGVVKKANGNSVTGKGEAMDWYCPCNVESQYGGNAPTAQNGAQGGGSVNARN
ncbi:hypothetical protein B0H11DRAFT_2230078 [Mycena galericulata]|nr:hypothetical protein B0H11DRAFT_2230078 [Mycena galericulata]